MQKYIFLSEEGDRWFERNRDKPREDPVTCCIAAHIRKRPERVLEIGCSDGRRLDIIRQLYGCEIMGVEPSMSAALEAAKLRVPVVQATASSPAVMGPFDLIIYGFCLYVTDPEDWLIIAAEGDRLLTTGGHIIIQDFGDIDKPRGVPYEHDTRITSWHQDWAKLWLGHPAYELIHRHWTTGDGHPDQQAISILRKNEVKR